MVSGEWWLSDPLFVAGCIEARLSNVISYLNFKIDNSNFNNDLLFEYTTSDKDLSSLRFPQDDKCTFKASSFSIVRKRPTFYGIWKTKKW